MPLPSYQKCIFPGCRNVRSSSVGLYRFPKNEEMKNRWIDFVKRHHDGKLQISNSSRLCSLHFTPESFTNLHQRQLGFSVDRLLLVRGAEPSIPLPDHHPPLSATPGAFADRACPAVSQQFPPTTREIGCQCDDTLEFTREVRWQTDLSKRREATQLFSTLGTRRTTALPSYEKCIFPGCRNVRSSSVGLYRFPKNEEMKNKWIDFVKRHHDGQLVINSRSRLCSDHFTPESFFNLQRRQIGFSVDRLLLVKGAEPSVSLPERHQSPPTTREIGCQCNDTLEFYREVRCQTDPSMGKRRAATQLSKRKLWKSRTTGCQATVSTRSVAVGNNEPLVLQFYTFTLLKQKTVSSDSPPTKHPLLHFPSAQECDVSSTLADPDRTTSTGISDLVGTTTEQAPTKPVQDMERLLVYEDCLLELFKVCPICSRLCQVDTLATGTLLSVTQKCLHQSCSYSRQWKSQ
ncbi:uncharacterized protein LOC121516696 isoform X2 [Cheilinus undulatus]|uniref:uncharacterized protein LOC121516696 isoform X2 n=1 Tax=Cheilinus undulatus TaxID=241271 RepID=UPI001BD4C71E|nr:uncharacterized protein LOC121516696 isoform X2 [Cheilinus undulatus]